MNGAERDLLAAEFAVGLLSGEARAEAAGLMAAEPQFGRLVMWWEERLQPLADALPPVDPDPKQWARIVESIRAGAPALPAPVASNDNEDVLRQRLRRWRGYGAVVTALAAALAGVVAIDAINSPVAPPMSPAAVRPLLVATLASPGALNSVAIAYDRSGGSMMVTPGNWTRDPTHDHVLWIIPPGGTPVAVGPCCQNGPQRHTIPDALAPHFQARSRVAVSVEAVGSTPAAPTGPFAVQGELLPI